MDPSQPTCVQLLPMTSIGDRRRQTTEADRRRRVALGDFVFDMPAGSHAMRKQNKYSRASRLVWFIAVGRLPYARCCYLLRRSLPSAPCPCPWLYRHQPKCQMSGVGVSIVPGGGGGHRLQQSRTRSLPRGLQYAPWLFLHVHERRADGRLTRPGLL